MIAVSIPAAEPQAAARSPDKAHTVFRVEVLCNGRRHTVAKRYSEFQALHKRIKKTCKVPNFPRAVSPTGCPKCWSSAGRAWSFTSGTSRLPSQRPVIGFCRDPYVRPPGTDLLPNTVLSGVLQGLYIPSCTPSQAARRAPGLTDSCAPTQHPGPQW
ncbi:unnamed protein product [Bubo scandiacus]